MSPNISFILTFDEESIYADNEDFNIHVCAKNISELLNNIHDELEFIQSFYLSKPDSELTDNAIKMKRKYETLVSRYNRRNTY